MCTAVMHNFLIVNYILQQLAYVGYCIIDMDQLVLVMGTHYVFCVL
jgi:hypothetical protein